MSTPRAYRFRYPFRLLGIGLILFLSAFLFYMPGVCGSAGLLGIDAPWAAWVSLALLVPGAFLFVVGLGLLTAVATIRFWRWSMRRATHLDLSRGSQYH